MPSLSSLERCTPDIYNLIFALACSDGGKTGAALALVSKTIAAQSQPHRFCSVFLPDYGRSVELVLTPMQMLSVNHAQDQRCVQHLFISDGRVALTTTRVLPELI
jgi:hypothetical protein